MSWLLSCLKNTGKTKFEDIKNIISSQIKFECKNHKGILVPQYYNCGPAGDVVRPVFIVA